MYSRVGPKQGVDWSEEADHEGKTSRGPATKIGDGAKDIRGSQAWGEDPKRDENCEEAQDVDDKDYTFDHREFAGEERVEQDAKSDNGNHQKGAVPPFENIGRIVQHDETLNGCANDERQRGETNLPAYNRDPANKPAEKALTALGSEFRYPVVLATRSWRD